MNLSISRADRTVWNTRNLDEAWSQRLTKKQLPYPSIPLYGTRRSSLISRSFHWQRMCTMFTEALYVPHRDLGRRTQTSPTSPDIYLSARGIKTHTSLRCSMLDRLLVVYPWIIKITNEMRWKKKNERTKKKKKNVTLYIRRKPAMARLHVSS